MLTHDHSLKWNVANNLGDTRQVDTRDMSYTVVSHENRLLELEYKVKACMELASSMNDFLDFCVQRHPMVYAEYMKLKSVTQYISTGIK